MSATPSLRPDGQERRRVPRYNVAVDAAFGPVGRANAHPVPHALQRTVTVNLSLAGLCLYSDILYPIGTTLLCVLTLPVRAEPVQIIGQLAWFQRVDQEPHGYKLGIEFTELAAADRRALEDLFNRPLEVTATRAKRLLLVDDDAELRLALQLRFESSGFQVVTAGDGLEGLRKGREERPHVIILDLMLPQLNGYEVCRLLKFDQKFRHIPIILCTARSRQEDRDLGLEAGADAYVTKPFSGEELIATVEALMRPDSR